MYAPKTDDALRSSEYSQWVYLLLLTKGGRTVSAAAHRRQERYLVPFEKGLGGSSVLPVHGQHYVIPELRHLGEASDVLVEEVADRDPLISLKDAKSFTLTFTMGPPARLWKYVMST
jgi:hypothetical protein